MLNVQALSSTLSAMSLPQLQQYASLHKDDPYVVTMALSIANQKKQAMTAQQGQAGMQPMPKVVDQDIAQIAPRSTPMPEDVGIGQLPVKNMQKMADGGIVGYADGGEVPRYQSQGLVQMPSAGSAYDIPGFAPGATQLGVMPQEGSSEDLPLLQRLFRDAQKAPTRSSVKNYTPAQAAALPATTPAATTPAAASTNQMAPSADTSAAATQQPSGRQTPQVRPATPPAAPAAPSVGGLPDLTPEGLMKQRQAILSAQDQNIPAAQQAGINQLTEAQRQLEQNANKRLEEDILKRGPAFTGQEARLKEREARLGKEETQAGSMALLEAGLAIMGGASPFALQNIGSGALHGMKSYKTSLKELGEARDKLDDAFGKIEEFRRTEGRMDDKERRDNLKAIDQTFVDAKRLGLSALMEQGKMNNETANKVFDTLAKSRLSVYEQEQQNKRTAMTVQAQKEIANMLPGEARVAMTVGTGKTEAEKLTSGLEAINAIKDRMTEAKLAELYVKHKKEAEATAQTPLSPTEFAKAIKGIVSAYNPKVVDVPSADAGKVYARPGT